MGHSTQCATTTAANIATPGCLPEMGLLRDDDGVITYTGLGIGVIAVFIGAGVVVFGLLPYIMAASDDIAVARAAVDAEMTAKTAANEYKAASALARSFERDGDWPAAAVAHARAAAAAERAAVSWADAGYHTGMFAQNEESAEYTMAAAAASAEWMAESAHAYDRAAESANRSGHVQKAAEFAASAHDARIKSLDIAYNAEFDEAERRVAGTLDAMAGMNLP